MVKALSFLPKQIEYWSQIGNDLPWDFQSAAESNSPQSARPPLHPHKPQLIAKKKTTLERMVLCGTGGAGGN